MTTRTVNLGFVLRDGLGHLEESLRKTASRACVSIYFHETPEEGTPRVAVVVDVWSENAGSVTDYCDFYLQQFAGRAYDFSLLEQAFTSYIQRLLAWYTAQKSKEAR